MRSLLWTLSNACMSSTISFLLIFVLAISGARAAEGHLYFTNVPSSVTPGNKYTITWAGGIPTDPFTIMLLKGPGPVSNSQVVYVVTTAATYGTYDWSPAYSLADGDDYELYIEQSGATDYSRPFTLSGGLPVSSLPILSLPVSESASETSSAEPTSTEYSSSSPATVTATVTESPTPPPNPLPASSASSTSLLNPTPTSSWDAERHEDKHLTVNDKIALGVGIPIVLIALSTLGYWRAVKFFLHRKVTGEPKLPIYGTYDPARNGSNGAFSVRSSYSSRPPSLWGATSRRGSMMPDSGFGASDTELLTAPKLAHSPSENRPSSSHSNHNNIRGSGLRQEWHAV